MPFISLEAGLKDQGKLDSLASWLDANTLDLAIDLASRQSHAVTAAYAASPADHVGRFACIAVQVAAEFHVPPLALEQFRMELDRYLSGQCRQYAAARREGDLAAPLVWSVPAGTFHQWRLVWSHSLEAQQERRWSRDESLVEGILQQARVGWREALI
jgi:hypothetical protein